jgi:AAA15 family ATPase/GTPase
MGFSQIKIKGFRSIQELEVSDLKRINLFGGKNNSGKTTVLESIFILAGAANPYLPIFTNGLREYKKFHEEDFILLFNKLNYQKVIILDSIEHSENQRQLIIKPILENIISIKENISNISTIIKGLINSYQYKSKSSEIKFNTTIRIESSEHHPDFDIREVQEKNYKEEFTCIFLNSSNILKELEDRVNEIILNKRKKDILEILQKLDSSVVDIDTMEDTVYFDTGLDKLVPIQVAGDGMKKILSIITAIQTCKNGIVIIDEIDNGLHYSAQKLLWKAIFDSCEKFNVQIFATTHSWECLNSFTEVVQNLESKDMITYTRLEKAENKHIAYTYSQNVLHTALESKWEVR